MKTLLVLLAASSCAAFAADRTANPNIDFPGFLQIAAKTEALRENRRLTEEEFARMAREPGTIVLDARSRDKYALRHVEGAVNLPFTDFTDAALKAVIPTKDTRVLIYCNNNFRGAPVSLVLKRREASLNISSFIALTTYGYTNVYELGPVLDVKTARLPFAGTEVGEKSR
jgi:rhodanese-related sulfurtransferase